MSSRPDLKLDWCSHEAAEYACKNWHYSRCTPSGRLSKIGVWEDSSFIGCIIFSHGANKNIGGPYRLNQYQCIELTRIALKNHKTPVSRLVKIAISIIKKKNPNLKLIVSYADIDQDHIGVVYQAGNWIYVGQTGVGARTGFIIKGRKTHNKTVHSRGVRETIKDVRTYLDPEAEEHFSFGKHKYLYPLSDDMRQKIEPLRKPHPKKKDMRVGSVAVSTSSSHEEGGGSIPTPTHLKIDGVDATT